MHHLLFTVLSFIDDGRCHIKGNRKKILFRQQKKIYLLLALSETNRYEFDVAKNCLIHSQVKIDITSDESPMDFDFDVD